MGTGGLRLTYFNMKPTTRSINLRHSEEVKRSKKIRGLGDLIERVAEKTGIKRLVERRESKTGKGCGCSKRRDALNALVPFSTEDETTETSND
jgi:hypothetical protein